MTTAGIIILGNSGVGKSFLANVILGTEAFVHKVRPTAVTLQTEYKPYQIDGKSYAVYNIPGLVEAKQERIDMNKREIDRAFVGHPYSVVVYVFSVTGGRIRDEDVVAFNAINKAYPLANKSLVIVVNNIPNMSADERSDYESEATPFLKTLLEIGFEHICYIYQLDPNSTDEKKAVRKELLKKIEVALPKIHKKEKEISLQVAELSNLKKQIADLQKQIEEDRKKARERDQETREEERRSRVPEGRGPFLDFVSDLANGFRMTSIHNDPYPEYQSHQPSRPVCSNPNGGRFTGEFVSSTGSANGRPIYEGVRGGQFHVTPNGNKSYIRKS